MSSFYGVFNPRGELVAAFNTSSHPYAKAAVDAYARYDWMAMGEALYWTVAPQPVTISRIDIDVVEPPKQPLHRLTDEPLQYCSCFGCPTHSPQRGISK